MYAEPSKFSNITYLLRKTVFWVIGCIIVVCVISRFYSGKAHPAVHDKLRWPTIMWYSREDPNGVFFRNDLSCFGEDETVQCHLIGKEPALKADGYLIYGPRFEGLPRRTQDTLIGLLHDEAPKYKIQLANENGLNLFNYSATFSLNSDVPLPLYHLPDYQHITERRYFIPTSVKNKLLKHIAPVIYLQSGCTDTIQRDYYVKELMKYIPIDSYGACLNNKNIYITRYYRENRAYLYNLHASPILKFLAKYKFVIAIENSICQDYFTEKFWRAIRLGVVPIYLGAPNIRQWMPNKKSAILVTDHPTPELLGKYLKELLANDSKYEEYLEHKTFGRITNRKIAEELESRPYQRVFKRIMHKLACELCKELHNKTNKQVKMVTKTHYNCSMPTSSGNFSVDAINVWRNEMQMGKDEINHKFYYQNQHPETEN